MINTEISRLARRKKSADAAFESAIASRGSSVPLDWRHIDEIQRDSDFFNKLVLSLTPRTVAEAVFKLNTAFGRCGVLEWDDSLESAQADGFEEEVAAFRAAVAELHNLMNGRTA